jgi:hypothetical protein
MKRNWSWSVKSAVTPVGLLKLQRNNTDAALGGARRMHQFLFITFMVNQLHFPQMRSEIVPFEARQRQTSTSYGVWCWNNFSSTDGCRAGLKRAYRRADCGSDDLFHANNNIKNTIITYNY